jgi:CSLREA domain-containing protein
VKIILRAISILVFSASFALAVNAATFVVDTTNDTADATPGNGVCADAVAACSLRAAISEANASAGDDIITLPAGTYTQTLVAANEDANAGGDWDINSNITINGAGSATTILQAAATPGTATERVMEVVGAANVVSIGGVTLRHGNKTGAAATATRGGGIRNFGTLTLSNSIVTLNNASGAGGVRNERTITLNGVTVSNNACNNGGTTCFGGGMYNTLTALSTVTITNCVFSNNTSTSPGANGFGFAAGAGIESTTGFNLVVSGSTFSGNQGVGTGTGGSNGNGIRMLPTATSTANITNSSFSGNSGSGGSSIQGSGITVFTSGAGNITGTWDGLIVNGNTGNSAGTGIFLNATGGAMTFTLRNSTISSNTGGISAGGVGVTNVGGTAASAITLNMLNNTISGNTVSTTGGGLGVEQPVAAIVTVNLNFCTIANNTATSGGGGIFRSTAGVVNLKNSLVGDNTGGAAPDISGSINSQDYNHIESTAGATIGGTTTNNTTGDALLGALAANGGPNNTHLPGAGSPVLNSIPSGTNDCGTTVTTEQRGLVTRAAGAGCEKGSVEVAAVVAVPATIAGQVRTSDGRGIKNVSVVLSGGGLPQPLVIQTGSFGSFGFTGILTGQTYTLSVSSKRFTFTPPSRSISLTGDSLSENFIADPGGILRAPEK